MKSHEGGSFRDHKVLPEASEVLPNLNHVDSPRL